MHTIELVTDFELEFDCSSSDYLADGCRSIAAAAILSSSDYLADGCRSIAAAERTSAKIDLDY